MSVLRRAGCGHGIAAKAATRRARKDRKLNAEGYSRELSDSGPIAACPPPNESKSRKYARGSGTCGQTIWMGRSTDTSVVITRLERCDNLGCL
jgi:hypothetical protein